MKEGKRIKGHGEGVHEERIVESVARDRRQRSQIPDPTGLGLLKKKKKNRQEVEKREPHERCGGQRWSRKSAWRTR